MVKILTAELVASAQNTYMKVGKILVNRTKNTAYRFQDSLKGLRFKNLMGLVGPLGRCFRVAPQHTELFIIGVYWRNTGGWAADRLTNPA